MDLEGNLSPPKAEATGSNPVGCTNIFKDLDRSFQHGRSAVSASCPHNPSFASQIREVAREIRRLGFGRNQTPETILEAKHSASERLNDIARQMETVS